MSNLLEPWVLLRLAAGLVATVLAVLWPAWRAQRVPVAEALRQSQ